MKLQATLLISLSLWTCVITKILLLQHPEMSSTHPGDPAENALYDIVNDRNEVKGKTVVKGKTEVKEKNVVKRKCAVTGGGGSLQWWKARIPTLALIKYFRIYIRHDSCCMAWYSNVKVWVSDSSGGNWKLCIDFKDTLQNPKMEPRKMRGDCPYNKQGGYIKVTQGNNKEMALCGIEVFGDNLDNPRLRPIRKEIPLIYDSNAIKIQSNRLLHTIARFGKEYSISFEVLLTSKVSPLLTSKVSTHGTTLPATHLPSDVGNVLYFTQWNRRTHARGYVEKHFPDVWFTSRGILYICPAIFATDVASDYHPSCPKSKEEFKTDAWIAVKIMQFQQLGTNDYLYDVAVNGVNIHSSKVNAPAVRENVKVYAGGIDNYGWMSHYTRQYKIQPGYIRNVIIKNRGS